MADISVGQRWEVYSQEAKAWFPVIITKIEGEQITLRYEGVLEFLTVSPDDMDDDQRFRVTAET